MTNDKGEGESGQRLLTDAEWELMGILWRLGEGTVHDVMEGLPPDRPLAYTSVSTILRILEQKGVVAARKEGRSHVYVPRMGREAFEARTVRHVVERVFDGAPSALVKALLGQGDISVQELAAIKELIRQAEGKP